LFIGGCATAPAVKNGFNFDKYEKIGVMRFVPYSKKRESSAAVSDEFIRQLIKREKSVIDIPKRSKKSMKSYRVIAADYEVDGIITGTVTKYIPDGKEHIYFKNEEGEIVSEVFLNDAEISISAKFIDGSSGEVVWSDSYSYSGFEMDDTISTVVNVILNRLEK
jgi:TolB-like protein